MKFIKSINELFDSKPYELELVEQSDKYWKYLFKTDKYEYKVEFTYDELGWQASHSNANYRGFLNTPHHELTKDNALRITQTVISALKDFLDKKKPESVILEYIPTKQDIAKKRNDIDRYVDVPYNRMNKRSRLQYNYLQNLDGYKIKYYYRVTGSYLVKTIGYIYKNNMSTQTFDAKMAYYDFLPVENK